VFIGIKWGKVKWGQVEIDERRPISAACVKICATLKISRQIEANKS